LKSKNAIKVNNSLDYQTNIPIFAIGDVILSRETEIDLCGFHEATLMCQAAYQIINPGKRMF
jgi:thioredoxin reductase (NADPH)